MRPKDLCRAWARSSAVVVDDAAQGIDQVVLADDLLESAPRQAYLASLLGIVDQLLDERPGLLEPAVAQWRVGDPAVEGIQMGPLISAAHRDTVASFLDGADVAFRGSAPVGDGFWFAPAVVLVATFPGST